MPIVYDKLATQEDLDSPLPDPSKENDSTDE